ncbi:MAG: hypothetical protein JSU68_03315 [Phycisphaerales bacterium]|nr:MAG: hypothetical protein JSU68_03315 [Phycisphaerales bacterium]
MSTLVYLMEADLGDLAYAIAVLIMAAASGIAGHLKRKKRKEQLQRDTVRPGRVELAREKKKEVQTLEELVEVFLPPEVRELRRRKEQEARKREAPRPLRPAEPFPPRVESPLHRPRPPAKPAPARPAPARPARPRTPKLETLVEGKHIEYELERAQAQKSEAAVLARPTRAPRVTLPRHLDKGDLRKAVVLNEVLGRPLGLRDQPGP